MHPLKLCASTTREGGLASGSLDHLRARAPVPRPVTPIASNFIQFPGVANR